jgi:ceramide glucosyltransferase
VQARFPGRDIAVVVNPALHGRNGKLSNLVNMMDAARHDILVIADSDVHCAPDYLSRIVSALQRDGTGLVTTVYAALAASRSLAGALGATAITHTFLPGALMGRALGRQDCLGATMALRRETLEAIGGFRAIANEIADDAVLGQLVRGLGLSVALADTVPVTTVPETGLVALFAHERRWGRTIMSVAPVHFAFSCVQYPLAWALLAVLLSGGAGWAWALLLTGWALRALAGRGIDRLLGLARKQWATPAPVWLLPLRDVLSVAVVLASYASDEVRWRGEVLTVRAMPNGMVPINTDAAGD